MGQGAPRQSEVRAIFDTDVMIWAFRGNVKALDAIDDDSERPISAVTYVERLQGVRSKNETLAKKRFPSTLAFAILPVTKEIPPLDAAAFRA